MSTDGEPFKKGDKVVITAERYRGRIAWITDIEIMVNIQEAGPSDVSERYRLAIVSDEHEAQVMGPEAVMRARRFKTNDLGWWTASEFVCYPWGIASQKPMTDRELAEADAAIAWEPD